MTKTYQWPTDQRLYDGPEDAFTSGARSTSQAAHEAGQPERERVMAQLSINRDGRGYEYSGYHYDRLADAVGYARLMRSRLLQDGVGGPYSHSMTLDAPTGAERELMASLAINFEAGAYRFEAFRYDHLADAVNYAKLAARRQKCGGDR